jgi:teichuronic acid biosynthesis glycosyltransferase TuaC
MAEIGVEVQVVAPVPYIPWPLSLLKKKWRDYARIPKSDVRKGIKVHYVRFIRPPGKWFRPFEGESTYFGVKGFVKRLKRDFDFDAIMGGMLTNDGRAAYRLGSDLKVPALSYAIGSDINLYPLESFITYNVAHELLHKLNGVVSVGGQFIKLIRKQFPDVEREIHWNPVGIDLSRFSTEKSDYLREKFDLSDDQVVGLYVGYLLEAKGLKTLMDALLQLKGSKLVMFLVGTGPLESYINDFIERNDLGDHCKLLGHVNFDELPPVYCSSDVFVFPSFSEGSPTVLVEAAACGLPIVASDIIQNQDVLTDSENGLLFKVGDHKDMALKLKEVCDSDDARELRSRFSKASREIALRDHERLVLANRLKDIIKGACDEFHERG